MQQIRQASALVPEALEPGAEFPDGSAEGLTAAGDLKMCVCVWGEGGGFRVGQGLRASSAIGDYCSHVFLFIFEPGTS